jgi:hypothetical protein
MPFSKVRITSAPISKLSLSSPLYTGKGSCLYELAADRAGPSGASPLAGQFRYMGLNVKGQRVGYVIDREGRFQGSAKAFDALVSIRKDRQTK